MGANVFRGHVSQDVGRLFFTRVSLLCFPIAQNSQLPFEALKNVPAGQHKTRPELPTKALSEMISAQVFKHQMWVKSSAFLNMSAELVTFDVSHFDTSELNFFALLNTAKRVPPKKRKDQTTTNNKKVPCQKHKNKITKRVRIVIR